MEKEKQVIITNGKAVTGMFDFSPGNGMRYEGEVNLSNLKDVVFTKTTIDNPAVEKTLRERYGIGNIPPRQLVYSSEKRTMEEESQIFIEKGDEIYSVVTPTGKKIHQDKHWAEKEILPLDFKIKVLKYVGY